MISLSWPLPGIGPEAATRAAHMPFVIRALFRLWEAEDRTLWAKTEVEKDTARQDVEDAYRSIGFSVAQVFLGLARDANAEYRETKAKFEKKASKKSRAGKKVS